MNISRRALCIFYGMVALLALVGTWYNNLQLLPGDFVSVNIRFWADTLVNPSSRSITVDILLLSLPIVCWMLTEARRLRIPGVWLYILGGTFIAISVTFPLFMIHRERIMGSVAKDLPGGKLQMGDIVGMALLCGISMAYTVIAIRA